MIFQEIYDDIVSSFGSLWQTKVRGNTLEIITPFASTNHRFVSVFLTKNQDEYIVTDGGWLCSNEYGITLTDMDDSQEKVLLHYLNTFKIQIVKGVGLTYYFKKTNNHLLVSSLVFDLANFISTLVSINNIAFFEIKEEEHSRFQNSANNFISGFTANNQISYNEFIDNDKVIKVNALYKLASGGKIIIVNYITGTNTNNFNASIYKTDFIFGMADRSPISNHIKSKIALVNNITTGYVPQKSNPYINYLVESTMAIKIDWSERERLTEILI